MDNLVMEVINYPPINKAKIEINKINVIGGVNGSGKSTASKIFYSFLKGNSTKRREYALQNILDDINAVIDELDYEGNDYYLPNHLVINDNDSYILKKYNEILEIIKEHGKLAKIKLVEINKEMNNVINNIIEMLVDSYCSENELTAIYESEKKKNQSLGERDLSYYPEDVIEEIKEHNNIFIWILVFGSVIGTIGHYEHPGDNIFLANDFLLSDEMQKIIKEEHKLLDFESQWYYFLKFVPLNFYSSFHIINFDFQDKLDRLFGEDSPDISRDAFEAMLSGEYVRSNHDLIFIEPRHKFRFYINLDGHEIDAYDYFFNNFIDNVYYADNVSLMDLSVENKFFHFEDLTEHLFHHWNLDLNLDSDVKNILEKIENMMKGTFNSPMQCFSTSIKGDNQIPHNHISSGIKQIGIIQLLLLNNKLQKGGYLIIDEPEVNLHPDWQFKFAEILVLLAKDLNITIYLNSHSPFFIEAIDAFTEFYDMQADVNYYLTEESEVEGKYDFVKIESDELYRIYDNLGRPYDLIDQLRLQKHLGE